MVLEIGKDVKKEWQVGDRIAAFVHGGNQSQKEDGMLSHIVALALLTS